MEPQKMQLHILCQKREMDAIKDHLKNVAVVTVMGTVTIKGLQESGRWQKDYGIRRVMISEVSYAFWEVVEVFEADLKQVTKILDDKFWREFLYMLPACNLWDGSAKITKLIGDKKKEVSELESTCCEVLDRKLPREIVTHIICKFF